MTIKWFYKHELSDGSIIESQLYDNKQDCAQAGARWLVNNTGATAVQIRYDEFTLTAWDSIVEVDDDGNEVNFSSPYAMDAVLQIKARMEGGRDAMLRLTAGEVLGLPPDAQAHVIRIVWGEGAIAPKGAWFKMTYYIEDSMGYVSRRSNSSSRNT